MSDEILKSVKLKLGIEPSETHFDDQLVDYINMALAELHQVGVGKTPFFIGNDPEYPDVWDDLNQNDFVTELCKTYVAKSVSSAFSPSPSSAMEQATKDICDRLLFRIHVAVDPGEDYG